MQFDFRKLLKASNLTIEEAAQEIGVSRFILSRRLANFTLDAEHRVKFADYCERKQVIRRALRLPVSEA